MNIINIFLWIVTLPLRLFFAVIICLLLATAIMLQLADEADDEYCEGDGISYYKPKNKARSNAAESVVFYLWESVKKVLWPFK
jgi:hypothetical protein